VEVYAGFSASEVLYHEDGSVAGVATRDVGIGKDGSKKSNYAPGIELRGRQVSSSSSSCSSGGRRREEFQ